MKQDSVDLIRMHKGGRVIDIKPMHETAYRHMGFVRDGEDEAKGKPDASASKKQAGE